MSDLTPISEQDQQVRFGPEILAGMVGASSLAMYSRDFRAYLDFAREPAEATKSQTLARWRAHLAQTTEYSPNTINRMMASVRTLMDAAEEQGYVVPGTAQAFKRVRGVKIVAMKERVKSNARTRISASQMRQIADTPDVSTLHGLRDRAFLHTWGSSGLRVEELVTLTIAQIVSSENGYQVQIIGKNDVEPRLAPLSREAYGYITDWLARRSVASPYLFTSFAGRGREQANHLTTVSAWRIVKSYALQCGIKDVKPHDGRRYVGTQLAKINPRTAQKVLGHKHISTTMDNYVLDDLEAGVTDNLF